MTESRQTVAPLHPPLNLIRHGLLAAAVIPTAFVLFFLHDIPVGPRISLLILSTLALLTMIRYSELAPSPKAVFLCAGLLGVIAVAIPPLGSNDIWSYVMVGKIFAQHHANPYLLAPSAFRHDPFSLRVSHVWRHTTTPYGPAFVAQAAVFAKLAGKSVLLNRLLFQGSAAVAILGILGVLWQRTRNVGALALVALHPLIWISVVNGGHNDAIVGLLLLCGVLALVDERYKAAGLFICLAILVKITAALVVPVLLIWMWRRHGWSITLRAMWFPIFVPIFIYLITPGAMRSVTRASENILSRADPWRLPGTLMVIFDLEGFSKHPAHTLVKLGQILVLLVAIFIAWRFRDADVPTLAAGAVLFGYCCLAPYILPWYVVWSLPLLALHARSRIASLAIIQATILLADYQFRTHLLATNMSVKYMISFILPSLLLGIFVYQTLVSRPVKVSADVPVR